MSSDNARPRRGWWVRSRAWIAILLLTPFTIAALSSDPLIAEGSRWRLLLHAIAWACFFSGVVWRWWATLYVGGRKERVLVSTGPYSLCRNPLYLGTFLIAAAVAFFIHSTTFAVGLVLAAVFYLGVTIPAEERTLRHEFGEVYERYCREVPRLLPRFRQVVSPPLIEVHTPGLRAELLRASRYVWIPLIVEVVSHLRLEAWWPHWWTLP